MTNSPVKSRESFRLQAGAPIVYNGDVIASIAKTGPARRMDEGSRKVLNSRETARGGKNDITGDMGENKVHRPMTGARGKKYLKQGMHTPDGILLISQGSISPKAPCKPSCIHVTQPKLLVFRNFQWLK
ncbi:hypothetical protein OH491_05340 [Termitidicoccus mucosus]|uniref:hypothetical protein n=1 Tax=Termitidicoccus mucosus TaxID=1184151 RepID=UPI002FEE39E3